MRATHVPLSLRGGGYPTLVPHGWQAKAHHGASCSTGPTSTGFIGSLHFGQRGGGLFSFDIRGLLYRPPCSGVLVS
jgi:hypothetical protein